MAGIFANVDSDISKLKELKSEIEGIKKALKGINVKVDIDIAKGMEAQLKSLTTQYNALVQKVSEAEGKIIASTQRINQASEKIIKAQEQLAQAAGSANGQSTTNKSNNAATQAETASLEAQAKAYDELASGINAVMGTRSQNVQRMVEEQNAIRLINEELKQLQKLQGSSSSPGVQARIAQLNDSLLTHKTALAEVRQELNNLAKLDNAAATSMDGLSQSLSRMRIAYRNLTEEERNSPFGKQLLASIQQADAEIKKLDASIGNHQRNVGNYASGWDGLGMSIQQIGRELPSLAVGWNTFFLAISNNLPILADEIKRARTEYEALRKAGLSATPVWKQIVSSLVSWQTALTVGITLLTLYGGELAGWASGLFSAKKALSETFEATEDFQKSTSKSLGNLMATFESLSSAWGKLGDGMEAKGRFITDNQEAFGKLGVSITSVLDAENLLSANKDNFTAAMEAKAKAAATMGIAAEQYEKAIRKMMEADSTQTNMWDRVQASLSRYGLMRAGYYEEAQNVTASQFTEKRRGGYQAQAEEAMEEARAVLEKYAQFSEEEQELLGEMGIKSADRMVENSVEAINASIALKRKALEKVTNREDYSRIEAEIKAEQAKLDAITGSGNASAGKREEAQRKLNDSQLSLQQQNQQAELDLMEEGTEKKLAQIDAEYDKRKAEIEKKARELAEANKKAGMKGTNASGLTPAQQAEIGRAYELNSANKSRQVQEAYKAEAEGMRAYLEEYGSYQQKKLAIAEEYAEKIRKAQTEGERLSLEKQRDNAVQQVEIDAIKQAIDWGSVFSGFGAMFKEQLQPTIDRLEEIASDESFRSSSLEEKEILYSLISSLRQSQSAWDGGMH